MLKNILISPCRSAMFRNICVGIHRYSALIYDVMKSYLKRVLDKKIRNGYTTRETRGGGGGYVINCQSSIQTNDYLLQIQVSFVKKKNVTINYRTLGVKVGLYISMQSYKALEPTFSPFLSMFSILIKAKFIPWNVAILITLKSSHFVQDVLLSRRVSTIDD